MTKSELDALVRWDELKLGRLTLYVPLLARELPFVLFAEPALGAGVTDKTAATINDVLALGPADLGRVKELLWEECNFAFQVADYGVQARAGETPLQAHLREFGLAGPDDALAQSEFREVNVFDEGAARYAQIMVSTGSGNYVSLIVRNGRIVDFDDDGTCLAWFDDDEQHARNKRSRVLGG